MNNITKDLKIFPFGNTVISNISLDGNDVVGIYKLLNSQIEKIKSAVDIIDNLSSKFKDGSYIRVQDDSIVIDIQELNVAFQQENFEFELFQVDEDQDGEEELKQLYFLKQNRQVVNNLLTDEGTEIVPPKDKANLVNNFFNIICMCHIISNFIIDNIK